MSEKDQEQFMKDTPVEGAPQFDVAAPAFVPKEEAEDLVVPEASGLFSDGVESNERRGRRASCFRNSGASKGG